MKRFSALLIAALAAGICLTACSVLMPVEPPPPTIAPTAVALPTLADLPAIATSTSRVEPSTTSTASSFSGASVSFDRLSLVIPTGVAAQGSGILVPEAKGEDIAPWDVAPEHILFTLESYALSGKFFQPQIYVYPAQAYAQLQERGTAAKSIEQLGTVLAQSAMVDLKELPCVPFFNVGPALAAQVKVIPFQHGWGVRMVTEYAMGPAIINNNELIYHFEGLSDDGQTYVIAILPVSAPGLPEDGQPGGVVPPDGVPLPDFNDMNADWMGYYGNVRQMLQGLNPGDYNPNLDQLDTLIESLSITALN